MEKSNIGNLKFLGHGWVQGTVEGYYFMAQVFDRPSCYGINDGKVSKLFVRPQGLNWGSTIISYDRGWDRQPETTKEQEILEAVMAYLA